MQFPIYEVNKGIYIWKKKHFVFHVHMQSHIADLVLVTS